MDNDNEIRRSINRSIDNFLDRESQNLPKENAGVQYDMQKAYMATKSNFWKRTAPVLIWMIGAVLGVVLITGAIVMARRNSYAADIGPMEIPCRIISAETLKNLLECYVEHNS